MSLGLKSCFCLDILSYPKRFCVSETFITRLDFLWLRGFKNEYQSNKFKVLRFIFYHRSIEYGYFLLFKSTWIRSIYIGSSVKNFITLHTSHVKSIMSADKYKNASACNKRHLKTLVRLTNSVWPNLVFRIPSPWLIKKLRTPSYIWQQRSKCNFLSSFGFFKCNFKSLR